MKLKKVFKHIIAGLLLVITLAGLFSNKAYAIDRSQRVPYDNESKLGYHLLTAIGLSDMEIQEHRKEGHSLEYVFLNTLYDLDTDEKIESAKKIVFEGALLSNYSIGNYAEGLGALDHNLKEYANITLKNPNYYTEAHNISIGHIQKNRELHFKFISKTKRVDIQYDETDKDLQPIIQELNNLTLYDHIITLFLYIFEYNVTTINELETFSIDQYIAKVNEKEWAENDKILSEIPIMGLFGQFANNKIHGMDLGDRVVYKLNEVSTQMFDGTISRTAETWQEAADLFTCYLLEDFSPNIKTFYSFFNITEENGNMKMISIFTIGGICLAALLLIWNIIVMMFGPITSSKDGPVKLIIRFSMVIIAIMFTKEIMNAAFAFTQTFWDELINFDFNNAGISQAFFPFGKTNSTFLGISGILGLIVTVVVGIVIFKNFIRLFAEVIERYLVTSLLYICFPVGVATAVGTSTAPIFKSYMRMIVSQLFIMVMNIWFIRMFFQLLSNSNNNNAVDGLVWFFFVIGFLRVAQRLDSYMASLGLNVAQTGGGILDSIGGAVFMMGQGMSMIKNGGKLGSRVAGAATREAAIRTGSAGLMSAGTLMSKAGGSRKVTGNMSGAERLAEAQIARGKTPTVSVNSSLWNKMAMGNVRSASGFSSNDIRDAFARNMSNDFLTNNKNLSSLTATNNGSVFHGYSTIGQTADGSKISAGFTLSREASADAIKYTDNYGNDWYQKFDKERSRSIQEGDMFYVNENIKALTGIDMSEVTKETEAFTNEDIGYVTKRNKGWEFSTDRGDFLAGRRKDGSYCFDAQQWHDYINPKNPQNSNS